jgi:hypothetical protein
MNTGERQVKKLQRRLGRVVVVRAVVRVSIFLFLAYGTVVLACRIFFHWAAGELLLGGCVLVPIILGVALHAWHGRPSLNPVRAALDYHNQAGGVLMSSAQAGATVWVESLPALRLPPLAWSCRQSLLLFTAAASYVLLTLLLPGLSADWSKQHHLEVGQLIQELNAQVDSLVEEKIVDPVKASEMKDQLSSLNQESSGHDPARTWEALDHLKQSTFETARQAAEETQTRLESLNLAETLAAALALTAPSNLNEQVTSEALRELGNLLQNAKLEQAALGGNLSPELLAALQTNAFQASQLGQVLRAIASYQGQLGESLTHLAQMKLIDPSLLAKCAGVCRGGDTNGLAAFLAACSSTNGAFTADWRCFGRGGVDRGRGDAPMTWTEGSSEEDVQFKEQVLPRTGFNPKESMLAGVSRANPQPADSREPTVAGALTGASAGGGSAAVYTILPRHQHAVRQFFRRDP